MKKFISALTEFKTWLCLCFTGSILIYAICGMIFGNGTIECTAVFQVLGISVGVTLLQYLCFSGKVLKKLRYSLRMLIFAVPMIGLLSLFAVVFHWLPEDRPEAWGTFLIIALIVFVGISLGFEIYFWAVGKKYDGLLGQYRAKREKSEAQEKGASDLHR